MDHTDEQLNAKGKRREEGVQCRECAGLDVICGWDTDVNIFQVQCAHVRWGVDLKCSIYVCINPDSSKKKKGP